MLDYDALRPLVDMEALKAFRVHSLNPEHPATRGTTVNPDIFFQCREACNQKFAAIPEAVEHYMAEIGKPDRPHPPSLRLLRRAGRGAGGDSHGLRR